MVAADMNSTLGTRPTPSKRPSLPPMPILPDSTPKALEQVRGANDRREKQSLLYMLKEQGLQNSLAMIEIHIEALIWLPHGQSVQ